MKYIKLIIIAAFLSTMFTGCSYVSDSIEGAITERSSFSATAEFLTTPNRIKITWDKTDTDAEFAGIEIYRTSKPNDEYAKYELVASRHDSIPLQSSVSVLESGLTTSCEVDPPATSGIYFYRVGIIYIERDDNDILYDKTLLGDYNSYTFIDAISGYAKVVIP